MSKVNVKVKNVTEKLFTVTWEEIVIIGAHIWAESPEDAILKAESRSFGDLVLPGGCFSEFVPGSCEVTDEIDGAKKKDYKSGGNRCIAIHY